MQVRSRSGRSRAKLGCAVVMVLGGPAFGQTASWTGPATGSYLTASNWSGGVVPSGPAFDVFIDGGRAQNSTVTLDNGANCRNLTISSGDKLQLNPPISPTPIVSVAAGTGTSSLNNAGTIEINSGMAFAFGSGTVIATGGGTILLNGGTLLGVSGLSTTSFSRGINTNNLIRGQGIIGSVLGDVSFTNQHIIRADVPGAGILVYAFTGAFNNAGQMQALAGSTLSLSTQGSGAPFTNTGTILAVGGGTVHLRDNAELVGGTFTTIGTGRMLVNQGGGSAPRIRSIVNQGTIEIADGASLEATGTITHNGVINLNSILDGCSLASVGSLMALDGTGTVNMTGPAARISGSTGNVWIDCQVQGQGTIASVSGQLAQFSTGTILCNVNGGSIVLDTGVGASLAGRVQATAGGAIVFDGVGGSQFTGTLGAIVADTGSEARLINGAVLDDCRFFGTGTGRMFVPGANTGNVSFLQNTAGSNLVVDAGATLIIRRSQLNTGTYTLLGALSQPAILSVSGGATATFLNGGTVVMTGPNAVITGAGGFRLFNTDNTIIGSGFLGNNALPITNNGTITARLGTLRLDPSNTGTSHFANGGTLQAISGGTLLFTGNGGGTFLSTTGSIRILTGGVASFDATSIMQGGTVLLDGTLFQSGSASFAQISGQGSFVNQPAGVTRATHVRGPTVTVGANGTLTINVGGGTLGTCRIGAVPSLPGRWDLTDHTLVVDYMFGSPLTAMRNHIVSGYNGGDWDGPGLMSSSAIGASPVTALGYVEANNLFNFFPQVFGGEVIDGTTVLIAYTLSGDTDLNRTVDIDDFGRVAATFNQASVWFSGDFDYNGFTDIDDFGLLAANFNVSLPAAGVNPRGSVPEPATLCLLAGLVLAGRRTRR